MNQLALGTGRIPTVTDDDLEHRVRMVLALAARQLGRGDVHAARATLIALEPEDFGRGAGDAQAPLSSLQHGPTSAQDLRVALRAFEELLPSQRGVPV